jgi:hypothetical protein
MLLENYIRLLLEAPQVKLGDLMKYPGKLLVGKNYQSYWEFANEEFKTINPQEDLSKRGPFFNCMKLCFDEFMSYESDPTYDIAENIRAMIIYINGLYDNRNNADVQAIYNSFISDSYNGFEELKSTYEKVYQFIGPKNLNYFANPTYIELLKSSQTEYLFDTPDRTMNGVLAVVPTTTASSIFWARTNAAAQQIVLTKLNRQIYSYPKTPDFLTWCTSFPDESNMFGSYFERGGTTLFYFLPVNDTEGLNKFCIGVTKVSTQEGRFNLICGGHTTVGFENVAFIPDGSDFTSNEIKQKILKRFGNLGLTKEMLNVIQTKVSGRNPFDKYAYIGKLKPAELAAAINMNTIGTTEDGKNSIKTQIETIFKTYADPEFLKDYQPNPKIVAIINKDIRYWTECSVDINYLPEKYKSDQNFWIQLFLTTNYSNAKEVKNKSVGKYFDYLQKISTQDVTADFVINFTEEFLNTCVANNLYSKKDPKVLRAEFEKLYENRFDDKIAKKLNACYNTVYDSFIIYSRFSDVPTETIMSWSDADILKYFNYQNNIKKAYPKSCAKYKRSNMSSIENGAFTYFIRPVGNTNYTTDELKKAERIKVATLRNYSQSLLSKLFLDYEDFKSFCKNTLDYNSDINIYNLLKYPLSYDASISQLLYPSEWMTDDLTANVDFSLDRISDIKDENIDEFISDNKNVLKKHFPALIKQIVEEYAYYIENIEENPLELILEKFNEDYGLLKKYDVIFKEIKDIEFQNDMQELAKINNFMNGQSAVKSDLIEYLKSAALKFNSLKSLPTTNSKVIFDFIKQFERGMFEFLISNKNLLLTVENSRIITDILKENNALELSTCQHFFWDLLNNPELAITDHTQIATFLKFCLIDNDKNFVFADINNNTIQIFDNQKDKNDFVNSKIFQNFLDGLQQFIIKTQNPKFIKLIFMSYLGHYNPIALNEQNINKLITYLFPDALSVTKRKLLFDTIVNMIMDSYPERFSKQFVEIFLQNFNLTNITIPDNDYDNEDDDINESIKFKLGNEILTERQLRLIIRKLL